MSGVPLADFFALLRQIATAEAEPLRLVRSLEPSWFLIIGPMRPRRRRTPDGTQKCQQTTAPSVKGSDMTAMKLTRVPNASPASADMSPDDDLWDVGRAARFLGLSRSWVYRTAEAGLLPYRRIASRLRFVPAELRAWAHAQAGGAR